MNATILFLFIFVMVKFFSGLVTNVDETINSDRLKIRMASELVQSEKGTLIVDSTQWIGCVTEATDPDTVRICWAPGEKDRPWARRTLAKRITNVEHHNTDYYSELSKKFLSGKKAKE